MTAVFSCLQKAETTRPKRLKNQEIRSSFDHLPNQPKLTKGHASCALEDEQKDDQNEGPSAGNVKDEEGKDEDEGNLNRHDAYLDEGVREENLHGVHAGDQTSLKETVFLQIKMLISISTQNKKPFYLFAR